MAATQRLMIDDLWGWLRSANGKRPKRAAVAYVTSDEVVSFRKGDVLVVDASDQAIANGNTSAKLLRRAFDNKATLVSVSGLHAKVMILGRWAVIGSANLSINAMEELIEAALVTSDPLTVSQCLAFVQDQQDNGLSIDEKFIERIEKIPVSRRTGSKRNRNKIKNFSRSTWLVRVWERDDPIGPEEAKIRRNGTAAAKLALARAGSSAKAVPYSCFPSGCSFAKNVQSGDVVVELWSASNAKNPSSALAPCSVLHKEVGQRWTYVYVHPKPLAGHELTWGAFKKLATKSGLPKITPRLRRLREDQARKLYAMWD